ncbi:MAG: phosphotransferase [Aestuariivirga sp.]
MDDQGIRQAREILSGMKLFWCLDDREILLTRIGGRGNLAFRVDHAGEQYVLHIPGQGTKDGIDHGHEAKAAREAAKAGAGPDVLHFDPATGVMVTRLVDDAVAMSAEKFKSIAGAAGRAGLVLRKLHGSAAKFDFRFEPFSTIEGYLKTLAAKSADLPPGASDVMRQAETVRKALNARPLPVAPCHCDPLCENFLDTDKRMWIVGWEHSGMGDPLWDVGGLLADGQVTSTQEEELIQAYFGGDPAPAVRGRIIAYKALCDLLWALRGLLLPAEKTPADTAKRFERCQELMARSEFQFHVAAVAKG